MDIECGVPCYTVSRLPLHMLKIYLSYTQHYASLMAGGMVIVEAVAHMR
jgi:hypothetical protein